MSIHSYNSDGAVGIDSLTHIHSYRKAAWHHIISPLQRDVMRLFLLLLIVSAMEAGSAFVTRCAPTSSSNRLGSPLFAVASPQEKVEQLKKVLEREYVSFFSPMEKGYYTKDVSFKDPLNEMSGIEAYENNVNMLSSKTLMGKILFCDAGIVLHNIQGGEILEDGSISELITRWTLRFTFKVMPWRPTARFTGISVYKVEQGGPKGVRIISQQDYWDSINLMEGGKYEAVDKSVGLSDFLDQLKPEQLAAPTAGSELPYQLLRRGKGYEVRRYPSFSAVQIPYERRDDGFLELGSFTRGLNPLAPALMTASEDKSKTMLWPLRYANPGETSPTADSKITSKAEAPEWSAFEIVTIPERVVAVGSFSDASMEPVVRKADGLLREACSKDGLKVDESSQGQLRFAQYDAIFSMGKRRGEVWINLVDGGHPW